MRILESYLEFISLRFTTLYLPLTDKQDLVSSEFNAVKWLFYHLRGVLLPVSHRPAYLSASHLLASKLTLVCTLPYHLSTSSQFPGPSSNYTNANHNSVTLSTMACSSTTLQGCNERQMRDPSTISLTICNHIICLRTESICQICDSMNSLPSEHAVLGVVSECFTANELLH